LIKKKSATFFIALFFILGFEPFNFFLSPFIVLSLLFFIALKEQPSRTACLFLHLASFFLGLVSIGFISASALSVEHLLGYHFC